MLKKVFVIACLAIGATFQTASAEQWTLAWKAVGLPNPESVVYDAQRNVLYVSNQNLKVAKGGGSISQMTLSGAIIKKKWIGDLNEPKGLAIVGDTLYVSDVTHLVEIDIPSAKVVKRYQGNGAKFLNDVTVDDAGNVYVSDMFTSAIYRLTSAKKFEVWLQSPDLENPNGLQIKDGHIFVAAWGGFNDGKPLEAPPGHLLKVSLVTRAIERVSSKPLGNLDGLQLTRDGDAILSDWVAGKVFKRSASGEQTLIADTEQSSGDVAYLAEQELLLVPMALQGEVLAYTRKDVARAGR